jgi:hypothetical protein
MRFHMAEYCDTPESKDRSTREYKACLRERAIPRLLDQDVTTYCSDILALYGAMFLRFPLSRSLMSFVRVR